MTCPSVKPEVFHSMLHVNVDELASYDELHLRPVLPCLVRMALCAPVDTSTAWKANRKKVLQILANVEIVNGIVALLSIDFHALEQDAKKEQQLRAKIGGSQTESVLISQIQQGLAREFEQSDPDRRLRLLLSELLFIMSQIRDVHREFFQKPSELFESEVYLEEVSDVLCIAQAELPGLLPVEEVAEALLHVKNGSWLLCRLVANTPDCFKGVCRSLVTRGEKLNEQCLDGERRSEMLRMMCAMSENEALAIRELCVTNCTLPGLAVALTLQTAHSADSSASKGSATASTSGSVSDIVSFVTGLLLGNEQTARTWFSQFIKIGQKHKDSRSMVYCLRQELLGGLNSVISGEGFRTRDDYVVHLRDDNVVQACAFIRLYCALKAIAMLKFSEEENECLVDLLTARPPVTAAGARFVCLSLSMLISCPALLATTEQEKQVIDWIRWLVAEEKKFEQLGTASTSYGEMLFLIAIHFHGNQTQAIADLVCATLGMKSGVKANALQRVRHILTQEIFTEQVITSHAVTVPITENLNANMTGFLPVHCIYQLLKTRTFSKYKVPIKGWIYRQICSTSSPLHPLLAPLVEAYITSIILPSTKSDYSNTAITEDEVLRLFHNSIFEPVKKNPGDVKDNSDPESFSATSQLLIVYYVLLYEDCRLSNMRSIALTSRAQKIYSDSLLSQLPISYLLQVSQSDPQAVGLLASLLRLLATHYPHLCLVDDWLDRSMVKMTSIQWSPQFKQNVLTTPETLTTAFEKMFTSPADIVSQLESLLEKESTELLPFAEILVSKSPGSLPEGVARRVQTLVKRTWFRLHSVMPRRLRLMTVNAIRLQPKGVVKPIPLTQNDVTVDPLAVLRCEDVVFRCPPVVEVVLRVLSSIPVACRVYLSTHLQAHPILDKSAQVSCELEREDLKHALISAQESAAVQILLECCVRGDNSQLNTGELSNLRETQGLICSHLHQMFISDPNLVKLVHFQGYPRELLPLTVTGIPSMHICLDFIPELIRQPQREKQTFAIELVAHLCSQYALPKTLIMAKLCINVMFTVLEVLQRDERVRFFVDTVPCLWRMCQAFPPLCEDVTLLLTQLARICLSELSANSNVTQTEFALEGKDSSLEEANHSASKRSRDAQVVSKRSVVKGGWQTYTAPNQYQQLYDLVQQTFSDVTQMALVTRMVY
ncbi:LOW QUALITY PROTEIN: integrator complex subunit 2-like [Liolophura sinensis]|uniref:LOW QUALITY PROTEIN: integrator complex subunit 2-like n=1 Tax=Liolophura sinensis TaxID=3198878 RepID=UPI0031585FDF